MLKRVLVAGCRNYTDYIQAKQYIDVCISAIKSQNTLVFISGGCKGADMLGAKYACENGYPLEFFLADWIKHGKKAGPIRNEQMAKACDYAIIFLDGKSRGTKSLISFILKYNKPYRLKNLQQSQNPSNKSK